MNIKFYLILYVFLLTSTQLFGQSLSPVVLASGGDFFTNSQFGSLDWTIGELMVDNKKAGDINLEEGFHHLFDTPVVSSHSLQEGIDIKVYPNPTNSLLRIEIDSKTEFHGIVYHLSGVQIKKFSLTKSANINLDEIPSGLYTLVIYDENIRVQSLLIQKVDSQ